MDYYILHNVLLAVILLSIIVSICYCYIKGQSKNLPYYHINNIKMESNKQFKEINIKNCTDSQFEDIININDIDLNNILLDEKSYENSLIYDMAYKTTFEPKLLGIIFHKVGGYIRKYDSTKHLEVTNSDYKNERIFDRIRYVIMLNSNISETYSHKYTKTKINLNDDLPLEKSLDMDNVT